MLTNQVARSLARKRTRKMKVLLLLLFHLFFLFLTTSTRTTFASTNNKNQHKIEGGSFTSTSTNRYFHHLNHRSSLLQLRKTNRITTSSRSKQQQLTETRNISRDQKRSSSYAIVVARNCRCDRGRCDGYLHCFKSFVLSPFWNKQQHHTTTASSKMTASLTTQQETTTLTISSSNKLKSRLRQQQQQQQHEEPHPYSPIGAATATATRKLPFDVGHNKQHQLPCLFVIGGSSCSDVGDKGLLSQEQQQQHNNNSSSSTNNINTVLVQRVRSILYQQRIVLQTCFVVALVSHVTEPIAIHKWQKMLRRNMIAGTIIFMIGDWFAQLFTFYNNNKKQKSTTTATTTIASSTTYKGTFVVDNSRFVISSILGTLWAGIVNPSIYSTVEHLLPGTDTKRVIIKMIITCSILSTMGNYITMMFRRFCKQWLLERTSKTTITTTRHILCSCIQSCNNDFYHVLLDDLKIWPLYDIICYSMISPKIRPITNAFMASTWSMYMSIASANDTTSNTSTTDKPSHSYSNSSSFATTTTTTTTERTSTESD